MSGSITAAPTALHRVAASRLPEAMRIAREIANNPQVSASVREIAAAVIRRHGLAVKLDS